MTEPIRMCLACRRRAAKAELVRLAVADPDPRPARADGESVAVGATAGRVAVDPSARRQGRGAYLCHRQGCLEQALRRGGAALRRSLRVAPRQVTVDADALAASWEVAVEARRPHSGQSDSADPSGRQR